MVTNFDGFRQGLTIERIILIAGDDYSALVRSGQDYLRREKTAENKDEAKMQINITESLTRVSRYKHPRLLVGMMHLLSLNSYWFV